MSSFDHPAASFPTWLVALDHKASDTSHDLICAILKNIFAQFEPSASDYFPARIKFIAIYG